MLPTYDSRHNTGGTHGIVPEGRLTKYGHLGERGRCTTQGELEAECREQEWLNKSNEKVSSLCARFLSSSYRELQPSAATEEPFGGQGEFAV